MKKLRKTKIALLCGGEGKRIRPLTEKIPKPLIEVGGKPLLEHILESYRSQGFHEFILCVGYKGEKIAQFVKKRRKFDCAISNYGEDASMLKRIHGLYHLFEEDLVVSYGDTFSDLPIPEAIRAHKASRKWVTIVTARIKSPFGLVDFDDKNIPRKFEEKPVLNYYIGTFIINKQAFDSISKNMLRMKDGTGLISLFKHLIELNQLNTYEHKKMHLTFNTAEEKKEAEIKIKHFYSIVEA